MPQRSATVANPVKPLSTIAREVLDCLPGPGAVAYVHDIAEDLLVAPLRGLKWPPNMRWQPRHRAVIKAIAELRDYLTMRVGDQAPIIIDHAPNIQDPTVADLKEGRYSTKGYQLSRRTYEWLAPRAKDASPED